MVITLDILNLDYVIQKSSLFEISKVYDIIGCKDIGIKNSEIMAKTPSVYFV